ncbi:serologically defined colon cancer antigen 8 isoform X3 [Antechinus flavipes]|uniref:serologically defined colon cancer antigen 8 isoform X3 n=1 Tax=Antechinus flavipes TaxID=38775 RepID=UPI002235A692|nr:serologically defined colon cancer antigen 8 isoform X3 [Antechinus flavipes]
MGFRGWTAPPRASSNYSCAPLTATSGSWESVGPLPDAEFLLDPSPYLGRLQTGGHCMEKALGDPALEEPLRIPTPEEPRKDSTREEPLRDPTVEEALGDSALEEALGHYQRSLRERASRSIHQLKCALQESDVIVGEDEFEHEDSCNETGTEGSGSTWHELHHSDAVNQLKALLKQQNNKENEVSTPRRRKMTSLVKTSENENASLPAIFDLVPIINDQSQYTHHLEAEVKFCKEELSGMKERIRVVVLENEKLQEELKSRSAEQKTDQIYIGNSWIKPVDDLRTCQGTKSHVTSDDLEQVKSTTSDLEKWQQELERLKLIYEEKNEILESQVKTLSLKFYRLKTSTRMYQSKSKDLSESQNMCEELKKKLRHQESALSASNCVGGLCLKCSQHEAVLAQTHTNSHIQTIERLTTERDELMSALVTVRKTLSEMQQMESNAYEQVKQAVLMTEEANFEKTKVLIQCEQFKTELERQKSRFEKELVIQQEKRLGEKEALRQEMKKEREELGATMLALSQNMAQLEAQVEKVTREKLSIANQLEEAQKQLSCHDVELTEVCGEMRYQLNQTKMKKDEAEKEHREYRTKTLRELEIKDQEIEKLKLELNESKQRIEQAQQDGARARDECIKLTELLGKTEHQLYLSRLEKESIQQSFSSNAKAQALQAQQREQELTQKMQQMEAQHEKAENERFSLLSSQNTFMAKLKEECRLLAQKLEEITDKSRCEVSQLNDENKYMTDKLEKLQKRNNELEDQCIQHGKIHDRMKLRPEETETGARSERWPASPPNYHMSLDSATTRLNQLDRHCQSTAQQLVLLLKKQNELFMERQTLTEEVQSLKSQLLSAPQSNCRPG